jgi:3-hydroxybutyryl-CoA dehydrogenase
VAREFSSIGVYGLGTAGADLTATLAAAGIDVVAVAPSQESLDRGRAAVEAASSAGGEEATSGGQITYSTSPSDLAGCGLVVEAVPEREAAKRAALAELDGAVAADAVLATTSSVLSVTALATATGSPSRVVGLHWSRRGPGAPLVEIVTTPVADDDVVDDLQALAERLGLTSAVVADQPGSLVDTLLLGYLNNAVGMLEARYASRDDIDAAMRFGCGHPMGPLALLDLVGLDTAYDMLDTLHRRTGDHLHAPQPLLKQLVTAGHLGRSTGRGFYTYAAPGSGEIVPDEASALAGGDAEPRPISRIGVIGTGTMASGIVEVCAKSGYDVVVRARSEDKVAAVRGRVEKSLGKAVAKGRLSEDDRDATLARVSGATEIADLADCDLVIEAVVEDLDVKTALFAELDAVAKPGAVLATTTSSLPVVELAAVTSRPADVIGMHWFNPAQVMKLVEIVPTVSTAEDVVATVRAVCAATRKHPVECGDRAGFIVNALLFPYLNDAVRLLESHAATREEIDAAMVAACGHPMGPFALIDVVGLDVTLAIQETLHGEFREPGLSPAPLLAQLVRAGYLGRKTGRGFLDYSKR